MGEESKLIITEVLTANKNTLGNKIVTKDTCKKIGEKLHRDYVSVYDHWRYILEPTLKMYKAGTLGKDFREDLLNHLLQQGVKYSQEVDWEELTKLPQFSGTTAPYLQLTYRNLVAQTGNKYPDTTKAERTTEFVKKYWDNREATARTEAPYKVVKRKKRLREDEIIQHYQELSTKHNATCL